jgi:hypothetical protein
LVQTNTFELTHSKWRAHQFYLAITLTRIAIVLRGFWSGYFGQLVRGGVTRPTIVHLLVPFV